jgi:hypothetical protein
LLAQLGVRESVGDFDKDVCAVGEILAKKLGIDDSDDTGGVR